MLKIVSEINLKYEKEPHLDKEILEKFCQGEESGIFCLSGGDESNINEYFIKKDIKKVKESFEYYEKLFGVGNFYFEINPQEFVEYKKEILENTINFVINDLKKPELLIFSQNPHYLNEGDRSAQKILFQIHGEEEDNSLFQYKFAKNDFSFTDTKKTKQIIENLIKKYNLEEKIKRYRLSEKQF